MQTHHCFISSSHSDSTSPNQMFRRCFKEAAPWWDAAQLRAPVPHRGRVALNALWKLEESERFRTITATYYHFNPPDPSACLRGPERGRTRGEEQEIESMLQRRQADVQVERLGGKIIPDQSSRSVVDWCRAAPHWHCPCLCTSGL